MSSLETSVFEIGFYEPNMAKRHAARRADVSPRAPPPRPPATDTDLFAKLLGVPNRLYGTTINSEGEAI